MALKTFTLSPKPEQNLDSIYAFGKGLISRGIIAGVTKSEGTVRLIMLPETAARYIGEKPSFGDDLAAVEDAIKAAGYSEQPAEVVAPEAPVEHGNRKKRKWSEVVTETETPTKSPDPAPTPVAEAS